MLWCRYFGCSPWISLASIWAVLFSMVWFSTGFTEMSVFASAAEFLQVPALKLLQISGLLPFWDRGFFPGFGIHILFLQSQSHPVRQWLSRACWTWGSRWVRFVDLLWLYFGGQCHIRGVCDGKMWFLQRIPTRCSLHIWESPRVCGERQRRWPLKPFSKRRTTLLLLRSSSLVQQPQKWSPCLPSDLFSPHQAQHGGAMRRTDWGQLLPLWGFIPIAMRGFHLGNLVWFWWGTWLLQHLCWRLWVTCRYPGNWRC